MLLSVDLLAEMSYEAIRVYQRSLGDDDYKPWKDASEDERGAMIHVVNFILDSEDPNINHIHNEWFEYMEDHGWVKGPTINAKLKRHPNVQSFNDLPEKNCWNNVFIISLIGGVKVLADSFGEKIERNKKHGKRKRKI